MIAAVVLACCLVAPSGAVYDATGQRQATVTESSPGRFEILDRYSNRIGSGRQAAPNAPVEVFDRFGRRLYDVRPDARAPQPGRSGGRR